MLQYQLTNAEGTVDPLIPVTGGTGPGVLLLCVEDAVDDAV